MKVVFERPESLLGNKTIYCPGCNHGIIHRLVAEAIDELGLRESTVGVAPVGCAVLLYDYFNFDIVEAPHGRAPAMATAMKRVRPNLTIFTYQGDGDLASIGMAEIMHAANRGDSLTVVFVNNANYGMTGGQMAPTTLPGQKTTTTPMGRVEKQHGFPFRMAEIIGGLPAVAYSSRVSVTNPKNIMKAKKAIKKAFENQVNDKGFSFVEVLSTCPTNWGMSPVDAIKWIDDVMSVYYPLGVFKDIDEEVQK
ncbi:2-oxoacid oxidoreductase, beta subunit [Deferribacter desulfuricans SSM1]|uniref:2-oxoacid oxidoreductase, beta subunit n=1 Tax=Deferribacter desulfuricans (strain DSM 14783 / JCM 11476 / NBRC 101012 / SSM1) TaxID=639282 RepID=D3PBZ3_DEFDS|nr:thiamine pyrophosphate-dependent enzyme [Deferribacter desulfuricans]BAI80116.1 2-oxoacid oxidoreductase, beta subunit [Deferribacter desulfuricans SSM1]